jgi:hypothetical protein
VVEVTEKLKEVHLPYPSVQAPIFLLKIAFFALGKKMHTVYTESQKQKFDQAYE